MTNASEWELCGLPVVERVKEEIRADVRKGLVPASVASFAALHDHVDANEYGGATEGEFDGSDEACAFWNRVQGEVDKWLKGGALQREFSITCDGCGTSLVGKDYNEYRRGPGTFRHGEPVTEHRYCIACDAKRPLAERW